MINPYTLGGSVIISLLNNMPSVADLGDGSSSANEFREIAKKLDALTSCLGIKRHSGIRVEG